MAPRFIALLAAASSVLAATNFGVKTATFYVQEGAYVCPGTATQVFYPDAGGKFPVVIYAHGQGGGLEGCDNALRTAASHGLVVIAPMTGGFDGGTCSSANAHKDIFRAIKFAKRQGRKQLPVLRSQANWRKLAVWGYSMGGKAATRAASRAGKRGVRFQALVAAHGARQSRKVPKHTDTLYVTSSEDTSSPPARQDVQGVQGERRAQEDIRQPPGSATHGGLRRRGPSWCWTDEPMGGEVPSMQPLW